VSDNGDYVRSYYGVPARIGGRVIAVGCPGRITGFSGWYLWVTLDDRDTGAPYHPTWRVDYLDDDGAVLFASPRAEAPAARPVVAGGASGDAS
jgi:hypothetical protein